jgi:hypothetical protein
MDMLVKEIERDSEGVRPRKFYENCTYAAKRASEIWDDILDLGADDDGLVLLP